MSSFDKTAIVNIFGIKVFSFEEYAGPDEEYGHTYTNIQFEDGQYAKYNGCVASVDSEGNIVVWSHDGEILERFFAIEIESYRNQLLKQLSQK